MGNALFGEINKAKADMGHIYNEPNPRAYFRELRELDYAIPGVAKPIFQKLIHHLQKNRDDTVRVLDLGCSYGVNAALLKHDSVSECSIIGASDEKWGEIVVACITPNGAQPDEATLDAHLRASALADFKRPRAYLFMDDLPKNAAGKVLRRNLRETAAQDIEASRKP